MLSVPINFIFSNNSTDTEVNLRGGIVTWIVREKASTTTTTPNQFNFPKNYYRIC